MDPKRQQMQEEIAALYARHGMNMGTQMLAGRLPLLLTMPFLFAFYRMLTVSVDLRGAPFLWIPDLSQKDPYSLTPVLMGVSMFAMQKMTPTSLDPAQQRIMMLMPVMLAGMFLWAPAGVNLYWVPAKLFSILPQGGGGGVIGAGEAPGGRERVFTGAGVAEALAAASAALGIAAERLRHVVLEEGAPGGRGLSATPARIAVLLEDPRAPLPDATPTSAPGPEGGRGGGRR